jgi:hypothetical protein
MKTASGTLFGHWRARRSAWPDAWIDKVEYRDRLARLGDAWD